MKAICLLLCLTLAREISGNIFQRRQNLPRYNAALPVVDFDDQSRERGDYKELLRPRQYSRHEDVSRQSESQEQGMKYEDQDYRVSSGRPQIAPGLLHFQRQQQMGHQERSQQAELIRYADPVHNQQDKSASRESNSAEKDHPQAYLNLPRRDLYPIPVFADRTSGVPSLLLKNAQKADEKYYGDVVQWRGIQIAADREHSIRKKDIEKIYREAQKAQKHLTEEEKEQLHQALSSEFSDDEEISLNATQLLKKNMYPVEEHVVKTEDGYYLTLLHIPPHKQAREVRPRPVVFLMHGLLGSADDYLLMGPGKSLAYLLSNEGYDVWLGNARSSKYAHHASKHRDQPDYWHFSNDEIALFDLPVMIDYVLQTSGQRKMFYIGHSLGSTAFFALAAARPEYNQKIAMMYAMSPMVYMNHARSPMLRAMAPSSPIYRRVETFLGNEEFDPSHELVHTLGGAMCENEIGCKHICSNAYVALAGINPLNLDVKKIRSILSHVPSGGSTKQMKQFSQGFDSHEFRMYNHGSKINKKVYGSSHPPKYSMKRVTAPVALYYSEHDFLAHPKDVKKLKKELPNMVESYKVPADYFGAMDFQFSKKAPKLVYQRLLESIQKHKSQH